MGKKQLTSAQYVENCGRKCPMCGSEDVSSEPIQADGDIAWADVTCGDCDSVWRDEFSLTGYTLKSNGGN